jgi:hypothetical protein
MLLTSLSLFFSNVPVMSTVACWRPFCTNNPAVASVPASVAVHVDPGTSAVFLVSLRLLTVTAIPSVANTPAVASVPAAVACL